MASRLFAMLSQALDDGDAIAAHDGMFPWERTCDWAVDLDKLADMALKDPRRSDLQQCVRIYKAMAIQRLEPAAAIPGRIRAAVHNKLISSVGVADIKPSFEPRDPEDLRLSKAAGAKPETPN